MSRLMSVAFTEDAVRERRKTVTRRKGWTFLCSLFDASSGVAAGSWLGGPETSE